METDTTFCYGVKDWVMHFENSESRKYKSLTWVPVKNKHDGKGYRRLCQHPKSVQVFCAWCLIVQVASKMPTRGLLADGDGPLTTSDLALKTGFPESIFEVALEVLADPKIAWLAREPWPRPEAPGDGGRNPVNRTEQNGTEQKGKPGRAPELDWEQFCRMKTAVCALMKRASGRLNHVEESTLAGIARRPESEGELAELMAFKAKPEAFFPESVESLVCNWDKTLDRARNYETNRKGKLRARNDGARNF